MIDVIGIDPGDVHTGWCRLRGQFADRVFAEETEELRPVDVAKRLLSTPQSCVWVVEEFRLYPERAMSQIGSTMPTCELIGEIKYLARTEHRKLVMQPAAIKKPTEGLMNHLDIKHQSVKRRVGGHAKDAETHAYHFVLRRLRKD